MCHTKTRLATPCYDEPTVTAITKPNIPYHALTHENVTQPTSTALTKRDLPCDTLRNRTLTA